MGRRLRLVLYLLILIVGLGALAWHQDVKTSGLIKYLSFAHPVKTQLPASNEIFDKGLETVPFTKVPATELRSALKKAYLLKPDRHFLEALGVILNIMRGSAPLPAQVEWDDSSSRWKVMYANEAIGTLSQYPNFQEQLALLEAFARNLKSYLKVSPQGSSDRAQKLKLIEQNMEYFFIPYLLQALSDVSALWEKNQLDGELVEKSGTILAYLLMQGSTDLDLFAPLKSRLLAMTALSKVLLGDAKTTRLESLAAFRLGYDRHGFDLMSKSSDIQDPVFLYYMEKNQELEYMAEKQPGLMAKYLHSLRLGYAGLSKQLWVFLSRNFKYPGARLSLLRPAFAVGSFDIWDCAPQFGLWTLHLSLAPLKEPQKEEESWLKALGQIINGEKKLLSDKETWFTRANAEILAVVSQFEKAEAKGLWSHKDIGAFYSGIYHSLLYRYFYHRLEIAASPEAATAALDAFGSLPTKVGQDFLKWGRLAVEVKKNEFKKADLLAFFAEKDIQVPDYFLYFINVAGHHFLATQPSFFDFYRRLVSQLDSRPDHRQKLSMIVLDKLFDVRLSEELASSVVDLLRSNNNQWFIWLNSFLEKDSKVIEAARDKNADWADRNFALMRLKSSRAPLKEEEFIQLFQDLMTDHPHRYGIIQNFSDYAISINKPEIAINPILGWLNKGEEEDSKIYAGMKEKLADIYLRLKDPTRACAVLENILLYRSAGPVLKKARCLEELGDLEKSLAHYKLVTEWFPSLLSSVLPLAEHYWRNNQIEEATKTLKSFPGEISLMAWTKTIPYSFYWGLAKKDMKYVLDAMKSLQTAGFDEEGLMYLCAEFNKNGKSEAAFHLCGLLNPRTGPVAVDVLVQRYAYLRWWKGDQEALAFIKKAVPPQFLNMSSVLIFRNEQPHLLWELIENPDAQAHGDYVWMLRAATHIAAGSKANPQHRERLIEHYKKADKTFYDKLGRYLLGQISEKEVLALATKPSSKVEAAFFIGVKAEAEKRYADASDWYRIVLELEQIGEGETMLAQGKLYGWYDSGRALPVLAKSANQ